MYVSRLYCKKIYKRRRKHRATENKYCSEAAENKIEGSNWIKYENKVPSNNINNIILYEL